MARRYTGCQILQQKFLSLELSRHTFDGIFANASLFHVPSQKLPRVQRAAKDLKVGLSEEIKPRISNLQF